MGAMSTDSRPVGPGARGPDRRPAAHPPRGAADAARPAADATRAPSASSRRWATSCTAAATTSRSSRPATRRSPTSTSGRSTRACGRRATRAGSRRYLQHTIEVAWRGGRPLRHRPRPHGAATASCSREHCPTPVITTMHGRLDTEGMPELLAAHPNVPLVAISESQRRFFPDQRWVATIHHGLPLGDMPFGDRARRLPAVRRAGSRPRRASRTRSRSAGRPASGSRSRPRSTWSRSTAHFREVVQPAIDDGRRSTSWASSGPRSAIRCTRVRWRR